MAAQGQTSVRGPQDTAMNGFTVDYHHSSSATKSPHSGNPQADIAAQDNFEDSGFFDSEHNGHNGRFTNNYEDFLLYDSDPPFVDDEASTRPNHGSMYNGTNNQDSAYLPKYTSYPPSVSGSNHVNTFREEVTDSSHSQNGPSLFANFYPATATGPTSLEDWASTHHRHEVLAYRYESLPAFTTITTSASATERQQSLSLTPPPSPRPAKRHRSKKSGKSRGKH